MIYIHQITELIEKMQEAGADVYGGEYIIFAHPLTSFDSGLFPLEIVLSNTVPILTAYITKKPVAK